ncbi:MAG: hemolysin family protein [Lachnospiraceae bacterium]|nr:hemolysin family protein [Lachnospiraceae bacterium]
MDSDSTIYIVALILLIILSAFFSAAETALTTLNPLRLRTLIDEGNEKAARTMKLLDNRAKMLSTILILNNVVNLSASALSTTLALKLFGDKAVAAATGLLTLIILIFGEIGPKNAATIYNEKFSFFCTGIIRFFVVILTPVVFVVDLLAGAFMRLFGIDRNKAQTMMTEGELRTIVEVSHEDGVIESEEREMINNVVDFGDSFAKDVMIPRVEMTCVDIESTYDELSLIFADKKYTRYPVYEDSTDNIVGIINMKDILFLSSEEISAFSIKTYLREANFTLEYKKTSDLMIEMRQNHISMVCVLDEYGATVGLVTLEDLIEEIVGEIRDEFDEDEEELIQEIEPNIYQIDGSLKLDDINDALGTDFDSENYDSIGGLVIEKLEKIPEEGEAAVLEDGSLIEIISMDKNHIDKVRLTIPEHPEEKESDSSDDDRENEVREKNDPD